MKTDDITLERLLPGFQDKSMAIEHAVKKLAVAYGNKDDVNSVCARFNKLIAHASDKRSSAGDYREDIEKLFGPIKELYEGIRIERIKTGHWPPEIGLGS